MSSSQMFVESLERRVFLSSAELVSHHEPAESSEGRSFELFVDNTARNASPKMRGTYRGSFKRLGFKQGMTLVVTSQQANRIKRRLYVGMNTEYYELSGGVARNGKFGMQYAKSALLVISIGGKIKGRVITGKFFIQTPTGSIRPSYTATRVRGI